VVSTRYDCSGLHGIRYFAISESSISDRLARYLKLCFSVARRYVLLVKRGQIFVLELIALHSVLEPILVAMSLTKYAAMPVRVSVAGQARSKFFVCSGYEDRTR